MYETVADPSAYKESFKQLACRRFGSRVMDELNRQAGLDSSSGVRKVVMEAYISRSTVGERAPPIKIVSASDGDVPPAEFVYSNKMFYAEGVEPEKRIRGCGCIGPCSEDSDCLCLRRQELYYNDFDGTRMKGFACKADGSLRDWQYPVWECGDGCECPPSCRNRVMQKGRSANADIEIFRTRWKGWGIRAKRDIPEGTFFGIYAGELLPEASAEQRGTVYNSVGRTYLFDIDFWHIRNPPEGLADVDRELHAEAQAAARELKEGAQRNLLEARARKMSEAPDSAEAEELMDADEEDFQSSFYTGAAAAKWVW
jgi:histone-lysine N-methyltransferase SUV39H